MPWISITPNQLASKLGVDIREIEQKHSLIKKIILVRKRNGMTQLDLARQLGVSQSRVAKIESRIGTDQVSFDVLFRILGALGYHCRITVKNGAVAA